MMGALPALITLLLTQISADAACVPAYNTSSSRISGKLNVHLVPHTHDDVGWLKTIDQYYYGAKQQIQLAGVQYVLDTVTQALALNKDRTFIYGEIAFLVRWWSEQTPTVKELFHDHVRRGHMEFVNGGYVQHDEAASHYSAMIDQTTLGHMWLNMTFGKIPSVGWQIDPFGHSATHASLLLGLMGYDALFFGRADYQDLALRKKQQELEMVWRGAKSFGDQADIFTGNFPDGNYNPPPGFNFEWGGWDPDNVIEDNTCLEELNVDQKVDAFVLECQKIANETRGDDIMLTMGTDFTYTNAWTWFKNMDKLVHYANLDGRLNVFYSTPSRYVAAKHSYGAAWPLKTDDFFPYADTPVSYWTNYFTARAASKGWIRSSTAFLQAVRHLEIFSRQQGKKGGLGSSLPVSGVDELVTAESPSGSLALWEAVSLLHHHDAITGTEKEAVAQDYHKRLSKALGLAEEQYLQDLGSLIRHDAASAALPGLQLGSGQARVRQGVLEQPHEASHAPPDALDLQICPFLNASVCDPTVEATRKGQGFTVALYNPLAWPRRELVRIPITSKGTGDWTVSGPDTSKHIEAQVIPVSASTKALQAAMVEADIIQQGRGGDAELAFLADMPPLAYVTFTVHKGSQGLAAASSSISSRQYAADEDASLAEALQHAASRAEDEAAEWLQKAALQLPDVKTTMLWYNASDEQGPPGSIKGTPSGAYIFRPNGQYAPTSPISEETVTGPLVSELRKEYFPWMSLTLRLVKGAPQAEVEWTVGPIPFKDGLGREAVVRYHTGIKSGTTFHTDANGREMLPRTLNHRDTWPLNVTQPIAGNYYPATAAAYIADEDTGEELTLVTDRAQGMASLGPGSLEAMLHFRTMFDDQRGVGEPLNETMCGCRLCSCKGLIVRGTHSLLLTGPDSAAEARRTLQQRVNDPLVAAFAAGTEQQGLQKQAGLQSLQGPRSALADPAGLPKNVHLLTLAAMPGDRVLLRLAHLYQVGEKANGLEQSVTVDAGSMFQDIAFDSGEELQLGAGQKLCEVNPLKFKAGKPLGPKAADDALEPLPAFKRSSPLSCSAGCRAKGDLEIKLQPMEIRTFLLTLA